MSSLAKLLGIDETDASWIAAVSAAKERYKSGVIDTSCPNGCVNMYDAETGEVFTGWGVAGCDYPICSGEQTHITEWSSSVPKEES